MLRVGVTTGFLELAGVAAVLVFLLFVESGTAMDGYAGAAVALFESGVLIPI